MTEQTKKDFFGRVLTWPSRPKVLIGFVIIFLFVILFTPVSFYKLRSSYTCSGCFSHRDVYQWWFGLADLWGFPVTPEWERSSFSETYKHYAPSNHQHTWVFAQGSPYRLGFIWYGCGIGRGRDVGELGQLYELNPAFRDYLAKLEHEKKLTHEEIFALLTLPLYPVKKGMDDSQINKAKQTCEKLMDDFERDKHSSLNP